MPGRPNENAWIARNEIIQERKDTLYINYIENDGSLFRSRASRSIDRTARPPAGSVVLAKALHHMYRYRYPFGFQPGGSPETAVITANPQ